MGFIPTNRHTLLLVVESMDDRPVHIRSEENRPRPPKLGVPSFESDRE